MNLGSNTISWCTSFKYLGVTFSAGNKLCVNIDVIKHNFFAACNSVLSNSHSLDQLIQLQLQESFCLPLLQYGLCAVKLTSTQCADLNCCWNTVFRRIFNFRKFDSVRLCISGLGRLDLHHIRISLCLKFVKNSVICSNVIVRFLSNLFTLSHEFQDICRQIDINPKTVLQSSFHYVKCAVYSHFTATTIS